MFAARAFAHNVEAKGRGVILASSERQNDGRAETLPDGYERRHWPSESDWCSLEVRCRMRIDECLPTSVVIQKYRGVQRSWF